METRIIPAHTEIRVYKLILNNMQDQKKEMSSIVAISTDYNKLVEWYQSQRTPETWHDGRWCKKFAKGSPLEWYNPPFCIELNGYDPYDQGIRDEWIREETYLEIINNNRYIVI